MLCCCAVTRGEGCSIWVLRSILRLSILIQIPHLSFRTDTETMFLFDPTMSALSLRKKKHSIHFVHFCEKHGARSMLSLRAQEQDLLLHVVCVLLQTHWRFIGYNKTFCGIISSLLHTCLLGVHYNTQFDISLLEMLTKPFFHLTKEDNDLDT